MLSKDDLHKKYDIVKWLLSDFKTYLFQRLRKTHQELGLRADQGLAVHLGKFGSDLVPEKLECANYSTDYLHYHPLHDDLKVQCEMEVYGNSYNCQSALVDFKYLPVAAIFPLIEAIDAPNTHYYSTDDNWRLTKFIGHVKENS